VPACTNCSPSATPRAATFNPFLDAAKLRQQALQDGLRPLRLAGVMKVAEGVTTLDEVLRSTPRGNSLSAAAGVARGA